MIFQPDYHHFSDVMRNVRPARLPIYEHLISDRVMEEVLNHKFADLVHEDLPEYFRHYVRFFVEMTYDVISFEVCLADLLPAHGAINGGKPGPIQNRADFEAYPWSELPEIYKKHAHPRFDAFVASLPSGCKAVGGVGNGVFELCEDLVGLEYLPYMQVDDPELYRDLFDQVGRTLMTVWSPVLERYREHFVAFRIGDDLGFKSSLLTNPVTIREHIVPQYQRLVDLIHSHQRPFLWHSCGNIFEIMEDFINLGIDAKHSNEDVIAPYDRWIKEYGTRIGLVGGFDMDFLCSSKPEEVYDGVLQAGQRFRATAKGYALGSGNSIPDYVPVDNYLAMIRAAQKIRKVEVKN